MTTLNLTDTLNVIHLQSAKAAEFLQSQLTNDVKEVNQTQLQWQAYCNRQGLVQSIFALWGSGENYYLLIAKDLVESTVALLKKYGVFSKINLEVLAPEIFLTLEEQEEKNLTWQIQDWNTKKLMLQWHSHFAHCSKIKDEYLLRLTLMQHNFPWLCQQTSDMFRPHELGLPALGIVNFKKGCYPGQEIIARTEYRGKPKQGFCVYEEKLDLFRNSTPVENLCVGSVLESSCTGVYTPVLRSEPPSTFLTGASFERDLLSGMLKPGDSVVEADQQIGRVIDVIQANDRCWVSAVLNLAEMRSKLPENESSCDQQSN